MSKYELDDEMVRACLHNGGASLPQYLADALSEQLPPDKEYLVKDGRDKSWRWDARQVAWYCIQSRDSFGQYNIDKIRDLIQQRRFDDPAMFPEMHWIEFAALSTLALEGNRTAIKALRLLERRVDFGGPLDWR